MLEIPMHFAPVNPPIKAAFVLAFCNSIHTLVAVVETDALSVAIPPIDPMYVPAGKYKVDDVTAVFVLFVSPVMDRSETS